MLFALVHGSPFVEFTVNHSMHVYYLSSKETIPSLKNLNASALSLTNRIVIVTRGCWFLSLG